MNISIFGLGYVGCVSAACFAADGHTVIGVDVNPVKVDLINAGRTPIVEAGLDALIAKNVAEGKLRATSNVAEAIAASDLSFVCVGTPSASNGSLDLDYVRRVAEDIGTVLGQHDKYHVVVLRSTMLPGSLEQEILPVLESAAQKRAGRDFGVAYNPEFLREGTAIQDFRLPPRTVIGEIDSRSGDTLAGLYEQLPAPLVRTTLRTAEMVKYADNAFHALKIAFANEIGNLCQVEDIDSHEVMRIFCLDTKLNLSPAYLKPGYAFGGSCLPKDLRALLYRVKTRDLSTPVLEAILPSNEIQKSRAEQLIRSLGKKKIGVVGLSFKPGTDDLRESPTVTLIEALVGKGYSVRVHDPNVLVTSLIGSNKAYIEHQLPHIANLMCDSLEQVLSEAEVVVVTNREADYASIPTLLRPGQILVDMAHLVDRPEEQSNTAYYGINW